MTRYAGERLQYGTHPFRYFYLAAAPLFVGVAGSAIEAWLFSTGNVSLGERLDHTHIGQLALHYPVPFFIVCSSFFVLFLIGLVYDLLHRQQTFRIGSAPGQILARAEGLKRETLNLGGKEAEQFRYITEPIQAIYDHVVNELRLALTDPQHSRNGVLILGAANAGKTRMAYEAMKTNLPKWFVFVWMPDDEIPSFTGIVDKRVIVFIDDLQDHIPAEAKDVRGVEQAVNSRATKLKNMLADIRRSAKQVIIVATCRSDARIPVYARHKQLFDELAVIEIPALPTQGKESIEIVASFEKYGAKHGADWDGNLGSLVLGLSPKKQQYDILLTNKELAAPILQSMKLLYLLDIRLHTIKRVRTICEGVFVQRPMTPGEWRDAVATLVQQEFLTEEFDVVAREEFLRIRKDIYFDKVIDDYPPKSQRRLQQDLDELLILFQDLADSEALFALGNYFFTQQDDDQPFVIPRTREERLGYEKALRAYDALITIRPTFVEALHNKANALRTLGRYAEALEAVDRAIAVDQNLSYLWRTQGDILRNMKRPTEAIQAYKTALNITPNYVLALIGRGHAQEDLALYQEALDSFQKAIDVATSPPFYAWRSKADTLRILKRYPEALAAHDHALADNPDYAYAWNGRGNVLSDMENDIEALASFERAIAIIPTFVQAWRGKAAALRKLGDIPAAEAAERQANELEMR